MAMSKKYEVKFYDDGAWIWDRLQEERNAGNPEFYAYLFDRIEAVYEDRIDLGDSSEQAKSYAFESFSEQIDTAVQEENAYEC